MFPPPTLYLSAGGSCNTIPSQSTVHLKIANTLEMLVELCYVQWSQKLVDSILQNEINYLTFLVWYVVVWHWYGCVSYLRRVIRPVCENIWQVNMVCLIVALGLPYTAY